jgi:GABA permease
VDDRVLVVATSNIGRAEIDAAIGGRFGNEAEVRVVAPASGLSKLQWLTNAEDDARADAGERAETVAEALPTENVDTEVGDSRPLQAITDALRTFPADQIVVVTRSADEATWLENDTAEAARERFAVPITHIVVG